MCEASVPNTKVGVVAPYAASIREARGPLGDRMDTVTVDTIDVFKRSEHTMVVILMIRNNSEGSIEFLGRLPDGPRRLNVAMTRAQRFCVLVDDWATLALSRPRAELLSYCG